MLLLVFSACAGPKNATTTADVDYMKMLRSSCFGKCPSYTVEVYRNGLVRYTGRLFVPDTGVYEKNIGAGQAQALLSRVKEYRVDTLKDSYELRIADLPGLNYTFKYGNKTKQVNNAHFGPLFLKSLANEVDDVIGRMDKNEAPKLGAGWKKINTAAK